MSVWTFFDIHIFTDIFILLCAAFDSDGCMKHMHALRDRDYQCFQQIYALSVECCIKKIKSNGKPKMMKQGKLKMEEYMYVYEGSIYTYIYKDNEEYYTCTCWK